jgi:hypothetical protein
MTTDTKTGEMFMDEDGKMQFKEPPHMVARINAVAVKIVFPFIAQKDVRLYLCGMNIRPLEAGGVMISATDGHRLIVVRDPDGYVEEELIVAVSKDAIKHCAVESEWIVMSNGNAWVQDAVTAAQTFIQPGNSRIDGQYPRYEGILTMRSNHREGIHGAVNPDFLRDALAIDTGSTSPTIRFWSTVDGSGALLFRVDQAAGLDAVGAIMPLRNVERELPTWIPHPGAFELLQETPPQKKPAKADKPLNTAGKGETRDTIGTGTYSPPDTPSPKPQAQPKDGKWPFPTKDGAKADDEMEVG